MQITINGEAQDAEVALKKEDPPSLVENLYVNGQQVKRVTHSLTDDVPVVLVMDGDYVVEVEHSLFYAMADMDYDWQPGEQSPSVDSLDAL